VRNASRRVYSSKCIKFTVRCGSDAEERGGISEGRSFIGQGCIAVFEVVVVTTAVASATDKIGRIIFLIV